MIRRLLGLSAVGFLLVACGGSAQPAEEAGGSSAPAEVAPPAAASAPEKTAEPEASGPSSIPSTCHKEGAICTANPRWVKKVCADLYPDVALVLFGPQSPFTRGYVTRKVKAVNASGGVTSGDEWLAFDEEVVLLYERAGPAGGMQVSGAEGGYDAMRWDGSCVTLDSNEVTTHKAPAPKYGRIDWRFLGEDVQEALKTVPAIREAFVARKKECKGAYSGDVSKACVQKDEALMRAIIQAVQNGTAKLPEPAKRP